MLLPLIFAVVHLISRVHSAGNPTNDLNDKNSGVFEPTHSLTRPYVDSSWNMFGFDYGRDTIVKVDHYVRLTSNLPSRSGWVFSKAPMIATNWRIIVEFHVNAAHALVGDGMGIWLTSHRALPGPVFGMTDRFHGLGILIDTYRNSRKGVQFPYIMAMLNDGTKVYNRDADGEGNELAGCNATPLRGRTTPSKLRITFVHDQYLSVDILYGETNPEEEEWKSCFLVPQVKLPSVTYLGFTAETGELSDNHDIYKVSTYNLAPDPSQIPGNTEGNGANWEKDRKSSTKSKKSKSGKSRRGKSSDKSRAWTVLLYRCLILGFFVGGLYVAFTLYRMWESRNKYRF